MIPSRPLDFGGIINEAIRIVKHTWWRAALVMLVCSIPGMFFMQLGLGNLVSGVDELVSKYVIHSDANLRLMRDNLVVHMDRPERLSIYRLQYPNVIDAVDSVHEALLKEYPDSASRAELHERWDSVSRATSPEHRKLTSDEIFEAMATGILWLAIGFLIYLLGTTAVVAANYDIASRAFEQRAVHLGRVFNKTFTRWMWLLLVQGILVLLAMLAGMGVVVGITTAISKWLGVLGVLASLVLMLYAFIRLIFAPVALVCEDLGPVASVKRSFALTEGHWWRVFGIVMLSGIMVIIVTVLIRTPFGYAIKFDEQWAVDLIQAQSGSFHTLMTNIRAMINTYFWVMLIPTAIVASLSPAVMTTFYYDLRTRLDGPLDYYDDSNQLSAPPAATEQAGEVATAESPSAEPTSPSSESTEQPPPPADETNRPE